MSPRQRQPLGGFGVGRDRLIAVTGFDGVAIAANCFGLLPGADSVAQHLNAVVFHEAAFGEVHRRFPLALEFGLLALLGQTTLLSLNCLGLQFTHQLWEAILERPSFTVAPAALAAVIETNPIGQVRASVPEDDPRWVVLAEMSWSEHPISEEWRPLWRAAWQTETLKNRLRAQE